MKKSIFISIILSLVVATATTHASTLTPPTSGSGLLKFPLLNYCRAKAQLLRVPLDPNDSGRYVKGTIFIIEN